MKTVDVHNIPLVGDVVSQDPLVELVDSKTQMLIDAVFKFRKTIDGIGMNEYQNAAILTAVYPQDMKVVYPTLGLCGETGEVAEKIKKWVRDGGYPKQLDEEKRQLLKKELGDVMWYLAALANDLNFTLADIAEHNISKLEDRQTRGVLKGEGDVR